MAKLHKESLRILQTADFNKRIESDAAFLKAEIAKFARIVRESGAKGD